MAIELPSRPTSPYGAVVNSRMPSTIGIFFGAGRSGAGEASAMRTSANVSKYFIVRTCCHTSYRRFSTSASEVILCVEEQAAAGGHRHRQSGAKNEHHLHAEEIGEHAGQHESDHLREKRHRDVGARDAADDLVRRFALQERLRDRKSVGK